MSVIWIIIGSGNGLAPSRRQTITWTNADLSSNGPIGTYSSGILTKLFAILDFIVFVGL